jgi:hypothetical protein
MKKTIFTIALTLTLPLTIGNLNTFAKKIQPKLEKPNSSDIFSKDLSSVVKHNATRGTTPSNNSLNNLPEDMKKLADSIHNQIYITPENTIIYQTKGLFEWSKPVCSDEAMCIISIEKVENQPEKTEVLKVENYTKNSYTLNIVEADLEPAIYTFLVYPSNQPKEETIANNKLTFAMMSDDEKKEINQDLVTIEESIKKENQNETSQDIEKLTEIHELNYFVKNGYWHDAIFKLNTIIAENPEDTELIEYKELLYKPIKGE